MGAMILFVKEYRSFVVFTLSTLVIGMLTLWSSVQPVAAASAFTVADHQSVQTQTVMPTAVNLTVSLEFIPSTAPIPGYAPPLSLPNSCTTPIPPPNQPPYIADLMVGLCKTGEVLSTATNGQLKLGQVMIYADGAHWADADIRIRAAGNYRPSAAVGGVVNAPTIFTPPVQSLEPITYTPGAVSLGRCWNGNESSCYNGSTYHPNWSAGPGYQVLVHELGHYLMTFFDEYIEDADPVWNPQECEKSLMANPYTLATFWQEPAQIKEECKLRNEQWQRSRLTDWQRINGGVFQLFAHQSVTPPPGLTTITYIPPAGSTTATLEPRLPLALSQAITQPLNQLDPQIYWQEMAGNSPVRILYQGSTTGQRTNNKLGEVMLLASPVANAQLHAYVETNGGQRFSYLGTIPTANNTGITLAPDILNADLNLHYGFTGERMTHLTATLQLPGLPALAPSFYLCVPGQICQSATLTTTINTEARATFTAAQFGTPNDFPQYGVVYVRLVNGKEVVRWFERLNGIRPGRMRAHAPLLDGRVNVQSFAQPDNLTIGARPSQALIMPATEAAIAGQPLPAGISGIIGTPIDLDAAPGVMLDADRQLAAPIAITLFYDPGVLQRLSVTPDKLTIIHIDRGSRRWCIANRPHLTVASSEVLRLDNAVTSSPMSKDGIYALAWGPNPANAGYPSDTHCATQNTAQPDLQLTKYTNATQVQPGETLQYQLRVRNIGAGAAPGPIDVTDQLPAPFTASGSWNVTDGWNCRAVNNQVTCRREGALPPGYEITLPLPTKVGNNFPDSSTIINCAKVAALNAFETTLKNNEACHTLPLPLPDLGDAPDSTNHFGVWMSAYLGVTANFPTVYGDPGGITGPRHRFPQLDAWLGEKVTGETDADLTPDDDGVANLEPAANAADSDQADDGVDPDSITIPACGQTHFQYYVQVVGPSARRYTNVWMDFNHDGDWQDAFQCRNGRTLYRVFEWAVRNQMTIRGTGSYLETTPLFAAMLPLKPEDPSMWMRISLSEKPATAGGGGPLGGYTYGETEDYLLQSIKAAGAAQVSEVIELDPATAPSPESGEAQHTEAADVLQNTLYLPFIARQE